MQINNDNRTQINLNPNENNIDLKDEIILEQDQPQKSHNAVIIVAIVSVLLLFTVLIYVAFQFGRKSNMPAQLSSNNVKDLKNEIGIELPSANDIDNVDSINIVEINGSFQDFASEYCPLS